MQISLLVLLVAGSPGWGAAAMTTPTATPPGATAVRDTGLKALQAAAASYDPATRTLTLTNGTKMTIAPNLSIEALTKGDLFLGTYQTKKGNGC